VRNRVAESIYFCLPSATSVAATARHRSRGPLILIK
jgi:hypothetical protein